MQPPCQPELERDRKTPGEKNWPVTSGCIALAVLLPAVMSACGVLSCHPVTVIVAEKRELVRLDTGPAPLRTTEAGRLREDIRPTFVREYWVQGRDGRWVRVSVDEYRAVGEGQALETCR
jgi:hypothetical protein